MSKTLAILLGLAGAWFIAWTIAGHHMRAAGSEKVAEAEHVRDLGEELVRGAEIGVRGEISDGPSFVAPYSETACLAAYTRTSIFSHFRDSQDRDVYQTNTIALRRTGPPEIAISVGGERVLLPLERWSPTTFVTESPNEVPERLHVSAAEIASAKSAARGNLGRYSVDEATLQAGQEFFVVGRLEDGDGPLRLEADGVLRKVQLYAGTKDDLVDQLSQSGGGLRVAGWILGAGVGPLPLAVIGLVLFVRWRRAAAASRASP